MMANVRYTDFTLYRRLLRQARPYWAHIVSIFLLGLLATPLALLTPIPLKIAVDSVVGSHPLPEFLNALLPTAVTRSDSAVLILAAGLVMLVALLGYIHEIGSSLLNTYIGEKMVLHFRSQLFRHVQRLSLSYHDLKGASDSAYRIQHDAPAIQSIAIDGVIPFITAGITLTGMIYVTARIDWQLAVVSLSVSPVLFLVLRAHRRRIRSEWREVKNLESSALAVVQEVLGSLRVVKSFGQEDREHERFINRSQRGVRARLRLTLADGSFTIVVGLTTAVGTASVLFIGIRHVKSGALTLGELLLVMSYLSQIFGPLRTMSRKVVSLQSSLASAERTLFLLDQAPDVIERPNARALMRASGAVAFRNISFAYNSERQILHDISFAVKPGTRVGIVGKTGAGKTTLMSLLIRFNDPTSGQILLDGVDLRDYQLADLRNQFAIVLQEPVLFSTSIAENIAYARPDASEAEIIKAAKAAGAHDFIIGLLEGYETLVGERGMRLSGGERQRISLARAFLKNAPMLILDEPTSSIDVKTEAAIMEAIEHLMHGCTSFMITHRLSALANCDTLLMIEDGQLVAETAAVSTAGAFPWSKVDATTTAG
jgi:ATP-binding cassette subfamily B protein